MPMEDHIDVRCPFCRFYLTDLDGIWECQEGCGAHEVMLWPPMKWMGQGDVIIWETSDFPFQGHLELMKNEEIYNSDGELIGGDRLDSILFESGRWE